MFEGEPMFPKRIPLVYLLFGSGVTSAGTGFALTDCSLGLDGIA
jgi:hypothetical protein